MIQSQEKANESLSDTSMPTPLPVQLLVVSLPAGTSMMTRHVASQQSQSAESSIQNSLAVVVRRMKEDALTNGTSEPTLDEIKVEYQCTLALKCAAGLQFPPLNIVVTSTIISHAMNVSAWTQQTMTADHWSASVTSVWTSHSGPVSTTESMAHEDCL